MDDLTHFGGEVMNFELLTEFLNKIRIFTNAVD